MVKSAKTSKSKAKPIELTKGSTLRFAHDTQTGMLQGIPRSARCVQRFDDSLNSAIHITYRISLRSSSMREPRYPLLTVVRGFRLGFAVSPAPSWCFLLDSFLGSRVRSAHP